MIARCPHCGTGHTVRYQPGRSPGSQRCGACGKGFAFFPALQIDLVGLPRNAARMDPVPVPPMPMPGHTSAEERPSPPRRATPRGRASRETGRLLRHTRDPGVRDWAFRIGGLVAGIALIGILLLQFLIHERAVFDRHPELAALSTVLCRHVPCPHPRAQDPGTIRITGLQLDEQAHGWLRLEMQVSNELDRPQPWPVLELALSDRFGRMLAQARWEPAEYLGADEAAGMLQAREVRRLRLVVDRPAGEAEGISVRTL
ncbi:MAG: DUF3426 domain-containing protein [Thioalkalivibrio sp.]|nr:MAG: DUF3426 domain-containing protein [Thioalkalivibrio sp.]